MRPLCVIDLHRLVDHVYRLLRAQAEARVQRARAVCERGTELKCEENQRRYPRPRDGHERSDEIEPAERAAHDRAVKLVQQTDVRFNYRRCGSTK
ncbi:hypothetical protein C1N62_05500 [Nissabacter sp. SGAir0207]|nr:hypothetical protein C1N62_05500 [Nissabacter sp. SGAir0207]